MAANIAHYDEWGLPGTDPHMAVPWAWAFDTPFKWTKQIASHFGGTRQGMASRGRPSIKDKGGHQDAIPSHDRHCADDPGSNTNQSARHG